MPPIRDVISFRPSEGRDEYYKTFFSVIQLPKNYGKILMHELVLRSRCSNILLKTPDYRSAQLIGPNSEVQKEKNGNHGCVENKSIQEGYLS